MKFLILLLISFSALANYIPESKVGSEDALTVYIKQAKCEKKESETCIKINKNYDPSYSEIIPSKQMKKEVEICEDEKDCDDKLELKACAKGYIVKDIENLEIFCTWLRLKHIAPNETKKAAKLLERKAIKDAATLENTRLKAIKTKIKETGFMNLEAQDQDKILLYMLKRL